MSAIDQKNIALRDEKVMVLNIGSEVGIGFLP
jgi:hypothetical protein